MCQSGWYEIEKEQWSEFKTNYGFMFDMYTRDMCKLEKVHIYVWHKFHYVWGRTDYVEQDYYWFEWIHDGGRNTGVGNSRDDGLGQCLYEFLVEKGRLKPHTFW